MKKKLLLLAFTSVLAMSMSVPVLAADTSKMFKKQGVPNATMKKPKKNISGFAPKFYETSDYITIYNPIHGSVFYKGEKIYSEVKFVGAWEDSYTIPTTHIFDKKRELLYSWCIPGGLPFNCSSTYVTEFPTDRLSPGKYSVMSASEQVDEDFESIPSSTPEVAEVDIYIRILKAPTSVKAKATKRKVTVSFEKATGAKKYEIYRSTKKTSGFKKIKTTTSRKYVDRNVKRDKQYYYKVKSVRTVRNTVESAYSKVARSNKVR